MLIPYLEVMKFELASKKDLVQLDHNLSIAYRFIDLVANLEIKIEVLESIRTSWDHTVAMIIQTNKPFMDKYGLIPSSQPQS